MKRRLNILCLMVIFVLSYSVLEAGYFFFIGAKLGVESVAEKEDTHALRQKLMHMKYISLESHSSLQWKGGELFRILYTMRRPEVCACQLLFHGGEH